MCDGDYTAKLLSQFLIRDDYRLIVNDLDALPEVDRISTKFIKCGPRQFSPQNTFVAPEQLWPHADKPFRLER